ncbi:hypothetical protein B0H16DRAFT_1500295 [Mycena metata]|uniref:Uncharacterized protein n=1 Tax=Mycena metata TaxID=1033252 RepID=A0AAD7NY44_9AGAR|nr:hypothetical protein B0H16DRAFT_1500295 [Mycena metata]
MSPAPFAQYQLHPTSTVHPHASPPFEVNPKVCRRIAYNARYPKTSQLLDTPYCEHSIRGTSTRTLLFLPDPRDFILDWNQCLPSLVSWFSNHAAATAATGNTDAATPAGAAPGSTTPRLAQMLNSIVAGTHQITERDYPSFFYEEGSYGTNDLEKELLRGDALPDLSLDPKSAINGLHEASSMVMAPISMRTRARSFKHVRRSERLAALRRDSREEHGARC